MYLNAPLSKLLFTFYTFNIRHLVTLPQEFLQWHFKLVIIVAEFEDAAHRQRER